MIVLDYEKILAKDKLLVVAPAGYGKTYTIAECLKYCKNKQLILTHTHAGVAALKEKIKKSDVSADRYHIETITSFARKYVNSFNCSKKLPVETDADYWKTVVELASNLVKVKPIMEIIRLSYTGLFVDEYQDCTFTQHSLIMNLSRIFPTRILGDELQGIFSFNKSDPIVNWSEDIPNDFVNNKLELD